MSLLSMWQYLQVRLGITRGENERGASLVEYALLVALIAVVCIVAIQFLGESASEKFSEIGSGVE